MERPRPSARYDDPARRRRRTISLGKSRASLEDPEKPRAQRLEEFARMNIPVRTSSADFDKHIAPIMTATESLRRPLESSSPLPQIVKPAKTGPSPPTPTARGLSNEQLRFKRSPQGSMNKTRELEYKDAHPATLSQPSRRQVSSMLEDDVFSTPIDPASTQTYQNASASRTSERADDGLVSEHLNQSARLASHRPLSTVIDPDAASSNGPPRSRQLPPLADDNHGGMEGSLYFRQESSKPWTLSYCSINATTGQLTARSASSGRFEREIVRNLRGCRIQTLLDPDVASAVLIVRSTGPSQVVHVRPQDSFQADAWFAALTFWGCVESRISLSPRRDRRGSLQPEPSIEVAKARPHARPQNDGAIIKVGKVLYMGSEENYLGAALRSKRVSPGSGPTNHPESPWLRVSCTLRDNGELKLYTTTDVSTLASVRLSKFPRSAVQRLHSTVFALHFSIAIYPQYSLSTKACSMARPIYLSFESRNLYEVWFVLLRAFCAPEIYGPDRSHSTTSARPSSVLPGLLPQLGTFWFRIERSLHIQVVEARLSPSSQHNNTPIDAQEETQKHTGQYYFQILLDGQVKAETSMKALSSHPIWYENFEIVDIPPSASSVLVQARTRQMSTGLGPPRIQKPSRGLYGTPKSKDMDEIDVSAGDILIDLTDMEPSKEAGNWWPLVDNAGQAAGKVLVKVRLERDTILMDHEYKLLSDFLHNHAATLTVQIAEKIPSELPRLAECLLSTFQASGEASGWLMSLAEEEIDGIRKENNSYTFYDAGPESKDGSNFNESFNSTSNRASMVRDATKTAVAEANLLFRGNTLLSKALDFHMKRLGRDYLENTIGAKMRMIAEEDPDCEIDPNRISRAANLPHNWQKLLLLTRQVWALIFASALHCPAELRVVFRHIRACTEGKYGDRLRNVRYSSVSGFLFLRFFCPAILNPRLFGLMNENARPYSQRTFTLIAKSLQGLANQTLFGTKETFMEPMNQFLSAHKHQFRDFIDSICALPSDYEASPLSPFYSTPLAIFTRLMPASREGFPSLPYLIDSSRNFAALVNLWLDNVGTVATVQTLEPDLLRFHRLCLELRQRTRDTFARAERFERRSSIVGRVKLKGNGSYDRTVGDVSTAPIMQGRDVPDAGRSPGGASSGFCSEIEGPSERSVKATRRGESTVFGLFGRRRRKEV